MGFGPFPEWRSKGFLLVSRLPAKGIQNPFSENTQVFSWPSNSFLASAGGWVYGSRSLAGSHKFVSWGSQENRWFPLGFPVRYNTRPSQKAKAYLRALSLLDGFKGKPQGSQPFCDSHILRPSQFLCCALLRQKTKFDVPQMSDLLVWEGHGGPTQISRKHQMNSILHVA